MGACVKYNMRAIVLRYRLEPGQEEVFEPFYMASRPTQVVQMCEVINNDGERTGEVVGKYEHNFEPVGEVVHVEIWD